MAPSLKYAESHSRASRRSWLSVVPSFLVAAIAVALVVIGIWGFWISADIARMAASDSIAPPKQNLSAVVFFLVWLVCFAPLLYFGAAILWITFAPESRSWLVPLRLFTFIVGLRAAAEVSRGSSNNKLGEKMLRAPGRPRQIRLSPDSTRGAEDPEE
jgi:hypothetical protein